MINWNEHKHRRIKIRRGFEKQRTEVVFEEGEPVFVKDTKRVYVGDSKKYGGNVATTKGFITDIEDAPVDCGPLDFYYNRNNGHAFIIQSNNEPLNVIQSISSCCGDFRTHIDTLSGLVKRLEVECCNPDLMITTDNDVNINTDRGMWLKKS